VRDEWQLRNPRHLKALLTACIQRGVEITPGLAAHDFEIRGGRVCRVLTAQGPLFADQVCLTSGAWTCVLAQRLGCALAIRPIRGQIALLASARQVLTHIVNEGRRYLVPRPDGRLLAGSTEDDAGFDRGTTVGGIEGLLAFALGLVPDLAQSQLERTWAGLRPATADGRAYLGAVPGLSNVFVAAGHFRSGLQLSTGTALVVGQLMRGETPPIDLGPFRLDRGREGDDSPLGAQRARREIPQL
jgi:glycine oxidase